MALCAPPGFIAFDNVQWEYFTTPNNTLTPSNGTEQGLIPDNLEGVGVAVFYAAGLQIPYTVSFEYWIFDDDGAENGNVFNSADGLSVMIAKDISPYAITDPSPGGALGAIPDGTGYTVDFAIYQTRRVQVRNGLGTVVAGPVIPAPSVYPHGQWRTVTIDVSNTGIDVTYEGNYTLGFPAVLNQTYDRLAFGAATGGSDGEHRIRNVQITCPP